MAVITQWTEFEKVIYNTAVSLAISVSSFSFIRPMGGWITGSGFPDWEDRQG
jgi:hypothetical protein